jgi:hypothetical protein
MHNFREKSPAGWNDGWLAGDQIFIYFLTASKQSQASKDKQAYASNNNHNNNNNTWKVIKISSRKRTNEESLTEGDIERTPDQPNTYDSERT